MPRHFLTATSVTAFQVNSTNLYSEASGIRSTSLCQAWFAKSSADKRRPDPVGLNAFRPQLSHVGGCGKHRRQRGRSGVNPIRRVLQRVVHIGVQPRRRGRRAGREEGFDLHCRVANDLGHLRHELGEILVGERPDVDASLSLRRDDVRPDAGFEHGRHHRSAEHRIVRRLELGQIPLGPGRTLRIHEILIARGFLGRTNRRLVFRNRF